MSELGITKAQYEELLRRGWRKSEIALAMPGELRAALRAGELENRAEALANGIKGSRDLWELHSALIDFEEEWEAQTEEGEIAIPFETFLDRYEIDICALPVFGKEWSNPTCVWSWDEGFMLVGEGPCKEWRIISRDEPYGGRS